MSDAHTPAADRLRPLRPSDVAVWAVGQLREVTQGGTDFLVCLAVGAVGLWLLLPTAFVSTVLVATAPLAGLHLAYVVRTRGPQGFATSERLAVLLTVLAALIGMVLLFLVALPLAASVWALACWEGFAHRPAGAKRTEPWWSHRRIADALVTAGVLSAADGSPTIGYLGTGREDAHAVWRTFRLPAGSTWRDVRAKHAELASAMNLPENRLHVERDDDQPANAVTLAVLKPREAKPVPAELPARVDFTQAVPLGADRLGRPQVLQTLDTHSAFVGKTRSGKTLLARYFVSHGLLDPRVPVWMVSGKDDAGDWQAMRPLCVRYETIADLEGVRDLLRDVETVSEYRGTLSGDVEPAPALLVIDEWYRIRSKAEVHNPALAKELTKLLSTLAVSVASRRIHLVMTFQRGTAAFIDADLRASLGQKAVGLTTKDVEVRTVLDMVPQVLPARQGEFLLTLDDVEPTLVQVPLLDNDAFRRLCDRAGELRADEPHGPVLPGDDELERTVVYPEVPEVEDDPLTLAVWDVLGRRGALQPSALFAELGEDVRPGSVVWLGRALRGMDGVRERWEGRTKVWELVPHPHGAPGSPRWLSARGELYPRQEQPVPPEALADLGYLPPEPATDGAQSPARGRNGAVPPVPPVMVEVAP